MSDWDFHFDAPDGGDHHDWDAAGLDLPGDSTPFDAGGEDLGFNFDSGLGEHHDYDLMGADPDEESLWDQFMLDVHGDVDPYVTS